MAFNHNYKQPVNVFMSLVCPPFSELISSINNRYCSTCTDVICDAIDTVTLSLTALV